MAEKKQEALAEDLTEMLKVRRDKLETYRGMGIAPFGHRYEVTYHAQDVRDEFSDVADEAEHGNVRLAGRLMAIRGHGKASFATLSDRSGSIQAGASRYPLVIVGIAYPPTSGPFPRRRIPPRPVRT
ncbi:MAG: hypothetical protein IKH16_00555 [Selenomonadaceae bacterium]|nr:hypothetical protein [Selenomonadaceae bacterium]